MIAKILIANRGEIARRIIRTAKKLGLQTVGLYTADEKDALWATEADYSVLLEGNPLSETYLNAKKVIDIAIKTGCNAIHPGYGFLSENSQFARMCAENGLVFIGPNTEAIELMGNKQLAREFSRKQGVPLPLSIEGTIDEITSNTHHLDFPVIIKASAGGGGKGMQTVHNPDELENKLVVAQREAKAWFGKEAVFVEQYFENARHIEVQILADNFGNVIHLFERECTLQRNYQKIMEEAPSPTLNEHQRKEICEAAVKLAKAANYSNAGTIEFLWSQGQFYFLEMNTRIQVEHPVTEIITGIDLVEQQILISNNLPLVIEQKDVKRNGCAIEARIYAENPAQDFKPSAGKIGFISFPKQQNARFENAYEQPTQLSNNFDGLVSKVIVYQTERNQAISALKNVLSETVVLGVETNKNFLIGLLSHPDIIQNTIHTKYLNQHLDALNDFTLQIIPQNLKYLPVIGYLTTFLEQQNPTPLTIWHQWNGLSMVSYKQVYDHHSHFHCMIQKDIHSWNLTIDGILFQLFEFTTINNLLRVVINAVEYKMFVYRSPDSVWIQFMGITYKFRSQHRRGEAIIERSMEFQALIKDFELKSPIHGKVLRLLVAQGEKVEPGTNIITIESMKTENHIASPVSGTVDKIWVETDLNVKENQLLVSFIN